MKKHIECRWWEAEDEELLSSLQSVVDKVVDDAQPRLVDLELYADLYNGAVTRRAAKTAQAARAEVLASEDTGRLRMNVIRSIADTAAAKMASNRPSPMFDTVEGDFGLRSTARKLKQFCEGVYANTNLYNKGIKAFRDAECFGTGVLKVFIDNDEVQIERILPKEVYVDKWESKYGDPRSLYHIRTMTRSSLERLYPEHAEQIRKAASVWGTLADRYQETHDNPEIVEVLEAWHLPPDTDAEGGRHIIALRDLVLYDEPWLDDCYPMVFFSWSEPLEGFWGTGLTEELYSIQLEINRLLRFIQDCMKLGSSPAVFVPSGSQINTRTINNELFNIYEVSGPPFDIKLFQTIHPETFAQLDRLVRMAYNISGISELSAASEKPAGLQSGRSMLVYNNIESQRFKVVGRAYEQFFMDISRAIIRTCKRHVEAGGMLEVQATSNGRMRAGVKALKWSDVNMEEDAYTMKVMPVSSLPSEPAGKMEMINLLNQQQLLSPDMVLSMLDIPDLDEFVSLMRASTDAILDSLDAIANEDEDIVPEPYDDLAACVKYGNAYRHRIARQGAPEEVLERVQAYIDAAKAMQEQAEEAARQQMMEMQQQSMAMQQPAPMMPPGEQV